MFSSNWIWKDLYVSTEGRLSPQSYFWGLFRIIFIFAIGSNILASLIPAFAPILGISFSIDTFKSLKIGNMAAFLLIVWPIWSLFRRRLNDTRPDWRARIGNWVVGFTIILVVLVLRIVASAFSIETPIDASMQGQLRTAFFAMLFGLGLVPGGDKVPNSILAKMQTQKPAATQPSLSGLVQPRGTITETTQFPMPARTVPRTNAEFKPTLLVGSTASSPVQRQHRMPEQGRVKPGWFS